MTKNGIIFAIFIFDTIYRICQFAPLCLLYEALSRLRDYELNKDL